MSTQSQYLDVTSITVPSEHNHFINIIFSAELSYPQGYSRNFKHLCGSASKGILQGSYTKLRYLEYIGRDVFELTSSY